MSLRISYTSLLLALLTIGLHAQPISDSVALKLWMQEDDAQTLALQLEERASKIKERLHHLLDHAVVRHDDEPNRPLIGIYSSPNDNGLRITGLVRHGGAEVSGLQRGDILMEVDGQAVSDLEEVRQLLTQYAIGDVVTVVYDRVGNMLTTQVKLTGAHPERDPCRVFIGVTVDNYRTDTRGVKVSHVIAGSPAFAAAVKPGDRILALDDVTISSYQELLAERNRHQPGDHFTLLVDREGKMQEIHARFEQCAADTAPTADDDMETDISVYEPSLSQVPATSLITRDWQVYPNPTIQEINLRFSAAAQPTLIQLTDISGRVVFEQQLSDFQGTYQAQLPLPKLRAGTYILQVSQQNAVRAERIVVLPRA